MSPSLSLCMIVKNEEKNLDRCLASVRGVADELVVVDTGSTDRTVEIARAHGARIFHQAWRDDFAEARNAALEQATGDWILQLDADEELAPDSRPCLKEVLAQAPVDGLYLVIRNYLPAGSAVEYDDFLLVRLFRRRPDYRYVHRVHEQITPAILRSGGKLGLTGLQIRHYGYANEVVQAGDRRDDRNIELLEQALAREPQHAYFCAKLGLQYYEEGKTALAETYLRRALTLDYQNLSVFVFQDMLTALGDMALTRKDFARAIDCASTSLDRLDQGPRALRAINLLAEAYLQLGLQDVDVLLRDLPKTWQPARLEAMRRHLDSARDQLTRLRAQPSLTSEGRSSVEARLAKCEALRQVGQELEAKYGTPPSAAATLEALLAADDLAAALQTHAGQLDDELLALVQTNAEAARQAGEQALAEGLGTLADYIVAHLPSQREEVPDAH